MKKKGRFVVEASYLVPGFSLLFVFLVFFTLYVHDYAVCVHTMVQCGVKGSYRLAWTDGQIENYVCQEIEEKLSERLLWMENREVEVSVNPLKIQITVSGIGGLLPVERVQISQKITRNLPCETIRRSRWLKTK